MTKHKDGKPGSLQDKRSSVLPMTTLLVALCGLSFYLGGIYCAEKNKFEVKNFKDIAKAVPSPKESTVAPLQMKFVTFPECSLDYQDHTPCTDPKRWRKYGMHRLTFMERHCPAVFERKERLVPLPKGTSCRSNGQRAGTNVGTDSALTVLVAVLADAYDILTLLKVASWGGDLLDRGILTVSLAPRDNHEAQVHPPWSEGIPAILGIISPQRLPFPSNSFDMAHCSRCLIPWTEFGGLYLLEINRILRPGGFWVLSGPPVNYQNRWRGWNTTVEEQKSDYDGLQKLLTSMCFKLYNKKDDIAVWQKTSNSSCYNCLAIPDAYPPKCDDSLEPDSAWYTPLRPCVVVPDPKLKKIGLKSVPKWPERLHIAPERMSQIHRGSASAFKHDDSKWKVRAKHYKKVLPALGTDKIRNVMDMNTVYGGFAAALIDDPLWVMNVVSSYGANTLAVVYDRGLIGTYHDWCEAFSTYPRTYDLHLDGLFTAEGPQFVLLEMDRILCLNGYIMMRESSYFIDAIATIAKGMRWGVTKKTQHGVKKEKLLVCQKKLLVSIEQEFAVKSEGRHTLHV
ncbi:hypothetical protein NL676_034982 [Syzygium grande]|nr:hypothetical protein NL676_034982 [Syzygium grande]